MPTFERTVEVQWQGNVTEGSGEAKARTGAFSLPVTFPARIGDPGGKTSPEELMAAAHAACYAMALNATLNRQGAKAARTTVTATVVADRGDAGIKITTSKLSVVVQGLEGLEAARFADVAREAEGRCPVSNALRNSLKIELDARVA